MKKHYLFIICFLLFVNAKSQNATQEIMDFRNAQEIKFKDPNKSPLTEEDRAHFKQLEYFAIDLDYRVEAILTKAITVEIIEVNTSSGKIKRFKKYGTLSFQLNGVSYELGAYQLYKPHAFGGDTSLFIMFNDLTNGESTYAAGRYIDVEIPKTNQLILDFNQSYNPYCAYSTGWACPIPPEGNQLDVKIEAGIKQYKEH